MSWSHKYVRTTEQRPYDHVLFCGICHVEVHVSRADRLTLAPEVERACEAHLIQHHPLRYRLWKRLRWRWLVAGLAP